MLQANAAAWGRRLCGSARLPVQVGLRQHLCLQLCLDQWGTGLRSLLAGLAAIGPSSSLGTQLQIALLSVTTTLDVVRVPQLGSSRAVLHMLHAVLAA